MKHYQMLVTLKDGSQFRSIPMEEGEDIGDGKIANDQLWAEIREVFVEMFKSQGDEDYFAHISLTTKATETEKEEMICNFSQVDRMVFRTWEDPQ